MTAITLILLMLAAFFNACMDLLQFHFFTSVFVKLSRLRKWLDPEQSWKNKWKKDTKGNITDRPLFPGSTTFLVWTTDAWHFMQMLMWTSLQVALALHFSIASSWVNHPTIALFCDVALFKFLMGTTETIILRTLRIKS